MELNVGDVVDIHVGESVPIRAILLDIYSDTGFSAVLTDGSVMHYDADAAWRFVRIGKIPGVPETLTDWGVQARDLTI